MLKFAPMGYLISFLAGVLAAVGTKKNHSNNANPEANKGGCHSFPDRPITVVSIPPAPTDEERAKQKKKDTRKTIKFVVEVVGVAVLIVYTGATVLTYIQIKNQFRADQRAWIAATVISDDPQPGKLFTIVLKMKDTGKTPALDVKVCTLTDFIPRPFVIPPLQECKDKDWRKAGMIVPVGEATLPSIVTPDGGLQNGLKVPGNGLTDAQFAPFQRGDILPRHYGKITYVDIFGCHHWLTFCQVWLVSEGTGRWQYCDIEKPYDTDKFDRCEK